jgi:hypothetical protein
MNTKTDRWIVHYKVRRGSRARLAGIAQRKAGGSCRCASISRDATIRVADFRGATSREHDSPRLVGFAEKRVAKLRTKISRERRKTAKPNHRSCVFSRSRGSVSSHTATRVVHLSVVRRDTLRAARHSRNSLDNLEFLLAANAALRLSNARDVTLQVVNLKRKL